MEEYHEWLVEIRGLNLASLEYAGNDQGKDLLHYLPDTGENLPSTLLERAELRNFWRLASSAFRKSSKPCSASTITKS